MNAVVAQTSRASPWIFGAPGADWYEIAVFLRVLQMSPSLQGEVPTWRLSELLQESADGLLVSFVIPLSQKDVIKMCFKATKKERKNWKLSCNWN